MLTYKRGVSFQDGYVKACAIQFTLDIIIFDAVKCFCLCYYIPLLTATYVQRAVKILKYCTKEIPLDISTDNLPCSGNIILNVPSYIYSSTIIAKEFPNLLESIVVNSYTSYLPGEWSFQWTSRDGSIWNDMQANNVLLNFSAYVVMMLKQGATKFCWIYSPVQKLILHAVQPLLLGASIFVCIACYHSTSTLASVIAILLILFGYLIYILANSSKLLKLLSLKPVIPLPHESEDTDVTMDVELGIRNNQNINPETAHQVEKLTKDVDAVVFHVAENKIPAMMSVGADSLSNVDSFNELNRKHSKSSSSAADESIVSKHDDLLSSSEDEKSKSLKSSSNNSSSFQKRNKNRFSVSDPSSVSSSDGDDDSL